MRVWIVLPAYNEEENIAAILDGFRRAQEETYNLIFELILVDDCSTDRTSEIATQNSAGLKLRILRNEKNLGLAGTFLRGMLTAAQEAAPEDIVICMDADNTHMPGQTLRMIRSIREGRDVVIASRFRSGAVVRGVAWNRMILSRGLSLLFRLIFPIPQVRDYSCGFRAYRAEFLQAAIAKYGDELLASTRGFDCMVGILLKLHKLGAICGEIPIVLRYDQKGWSIKNASADHHPRYFEGARA